MAEGDPNPSPEPKPNQGRNYEQELANTRAESAANRIERQKEKERADKLEADLATEKAAREKAVKDKDDEYAPRIEKANKRIIESEIKSVAIASGLKDLDLLALIKRDDIKLDDDGNVTGVEEAIKVFKEAKPDYFDKRKGDDNSNQNQHQQQQQQNKKVGNNITPPKPDPNPKPQSAKKMTPEEYREHKKKTLAELRQAG